MTLAGFKDHRAPTMDLGPRVKSNAPLVAVLFSRLGPYHHARLKAAGSRLQVTGVEFSNVDPTYAWDLVEGANGFQRLTLFSGTALHELSADRIYGRVCEALDRLRPQVVAIPGWHDRCSLAALRWCNSRGVSAVVMSESTAWDTERSWWKEFLKRRVVKLCVAGLVGGQAHADYLEQLGIKRENIFLGYDAVDNDYFTKRAEEARGRRSEVRGQNGLPERYFLASARFVKKKNLVSLIKAYAGYRELGESRKQKAESGKEGKMGDEGQKTESRKQKAGSGDRSQKSDIRSQMSDLRPQTSDLWHLVLLGDGPLKPDLCRLIADLGVQDFVHLPGFKQYDELPVYYGLASAFVHASTTEQWGLVVNEAMASGLPVLVSNRCGCAADLVQEGRNGFCFDPCDLEALARLMAKISGSDFPLSEFGAASQQIIREWSPDKFAENLKAACEVAMTGEPANNSYLAIGITNLLIHLPKRVLKRTDERPDGSNKSKLEGSSIANIGPNFFIIGAPKSGTTSLSEYLKGHRNIFFSPVKEPHFFDLDTSKRLKLKLRTYLSLFSEAEPGVHKAVGEGSTGYLFSKVAVSEILKFNPDARFIVMLRNPLELVPSWHSEMYFEGVENVRDFETAWKLEPERRQGRNIPKTCWEPKKLFYSDWGKLGEQIERLFSVVQRDRVKVILFDDFVADTKGVYEEVLSFLEVPPDGREDFQPVNENKTLRYPWLQRSLAFGANHFRQIRVASGLKLSLGLGLSQKLLLLNSKPSTRKTISPVLRAELADFFRDDVRKLSKLLGRDLSHWVIKR